MFFFFNFITGLLPYSHHELLLLGRSVYKTKTIIFWCKIYFEGSPHVVTWLGPNLSRHFESTACLASCTHDTALLGWEGWIYALYTERAAFDLRVKRLLWFKERMQFSGILWHMNRQKDLSNLTDDGDVSDTFVFFFPRKIRNTQSNQQKHYPDHDFFTPC